MNIFFRLALAASFLPSAVTARHDQNVLEPPKARTRPNIVFILTDDQDLHMDSMSYMPFVQKHLINQGTFYKRHYCTVALCCPSRVNLWTGRAAHNTNVTDLMPPYGGYPKFVSQGLNEAYLPVWLQQAGYRTYYTGKLFNTHTVDNYNAPFPAGFTGSDFLLDPFTYSYLNSTFQRNQDLPMSYEGEYSTDVLARKAYGFLEEAVHSQEPFFLAIAPVAPHTNLDFPPSYNQSFNGTFHPGDIKISPPVAAERHHHLFQNAIVPRKPNFNPLKPSSVNWISTLPHQNASNIASNDELYRARLRSLQAVDELVDGLISRLDAHGITDKTYIIYTSDNGFHISQHRLQPGKECGFEEDINVPLVIRGPTVPRGAVSEIVSSHTDLAPTIMRLVGATPRDDFDGVAIPVTENELMDAEREHHEHVNVEFWGVALTEGKYGELAHLNNTYKALRLIGRGYNLYYAVWCNNAHELYDLNRDPFQLTNLVSSPSPLLGLPLRKVVARLDALLLVLKSCKGTVCARPWDLLHPDGRVGGLYDALDSEFDEFYEREQRRVEFSRCERGYLVDAEGPQEALVYRGGVRWSELV